MQHRKIFNNFDIALVLYAKPLNYLFSHNHRDQLKQLWEVLQECCCLHQHAATTEMCHPGHRQASYSYYWATCPLIHHLITKPWSTNVQVFYTVIKSIQTEDSLYKITNTNSDRKCMDSALIVACIFPESCKAFNCSAVCTFTFQIKKCLNIAVILPCYISCQYWH